MPIGQSNSATSLLLPWHEADDAAAPPGPAHLRLAALLRRQVTGGRLRPGDRLPPSRALAEELGLSRWVVTEAYDQLKAEGYLAARVGAGTVVAAGVRSAAPPATGTAAHRSPPGPPLLDLSPALPDLASFPRTAWRAAVGRALAAATDDELGHPDPQGAPALRETVADYLRRVRGLAATGGEVHVTQGVRNAVAVLCALLRARGATRVAVEDPCWPRLRQTARDSGLEVVPVGVDGDGVDVRALVAAGVDAAFVAPTHQFPTGVPLVPRRRLALATWAAEGDRLVIEDDYDAEFRYDRRPVGALAPLAREHVVYLGSVSKTLSPSLHLGWMVAPARLTGALAEVRGAWAAQAPTLDQLALVDLLRSGAYDRHLRRMRRHYQARRTALLRAFTAQVPGRAAASMDAGLHVLWLLPEGTDGSHEAAVLRACADRGVQPAGLSASRVAAGPAGLVVGYGNVPPHRADDVARAVRDAVASVLARHHPPPP